MTLRRPFPTAFAFLASSEYVFDQPKSATELTLRIAAEGVLSNGLQVLAVNCGLLCFEFAGTPLGKFDKLDFRGGGEVPKEVMTNNDDMLVLQSRRLQLAVFVAACIFGRHTFLARTSMRGPRYPGLGDIYGGDRRGNHWTLSDPDIERLNPNLRERLVALSRGHSSGASIPVEHVHEGLALADRLLAKGTEAEVADFMALVVMTYQGAILHNRQHAGASIALSAMILEVAVQELFFVYGLVTGVPARPHAVKAHTCGPVSRNAFKQLGNQGRLEHLAAGGLISPYLEQRIEAVRKARNDLMHRGQDVQAGKSGEGLTSVREILQLCTGEDFELNAVFTYRTA